MGKIEFTSIGKMICDQIYPQQQPRQGFYANNSGFIELNNDKNIIEGLKGIDDFDYIWIIYHLDKNSKWKPLISPPVQSIKEKIGVFASRSPYRPNQIGLSVVKLIKVEKNRLYIENFDLLNNTPIIDIKPYISIYDSIENSKNGWVPDYKKEEYKLYFSNIFLNKNKFVKNHVNFDLKDFCLVQLKFNPVDKNKKRVKRIRKNQFIIAFRTWRIQFIINDKLINVENIFSSYSVVDLNQNIKEDKYGDKKSHILFNEKFGIIKNSFF